MERRACCILRTSRSSAASRALSSAIWAEWTSSGVRRMPGRMRRTSEAEWCLSASTPQFSSSVSSSRLSSMRSRIMGRAYSLRSVAAMAA